MQCSRCVSDDSFGNITFDEKGVCNYCHIHDDMEKKYPTGPEGERLLSILAEDIKKSGHGKTFDAVVGVSGGKDSSYLLYLCTKLGIRALAVHYDNGWDTPISSKNIKIMTDILGISLINYKIKQEEVDDLIKSFLFSHTQDAEAPTDLVLMKCLFRIASTYGIKYILDGHSFRTEGIAPLGWSYMDGRYIKSVHAKYGTVPLSTYPLLTLSDQLWYGMKGIKRPRLLYYIDYSSEGTRRFLENQFGWEWYGGHHLENTYTAFFDYFYRYNKLGYDGRKVELSALIRSGQTTRENAICELSVPPTVPIDEVKQRLKLSDADFNEIMNPEKKLTHKDWKTYRKHFRLLKPIFWAMAKTKRIPDSFYIKYCKGAE